MKKVSVIIPAMNEGKNMVRLLDDLLVMEGELKEYVLEKIVVDDHSCDNTALIAHNKKCLVVRNNGKSGKGNALKAGFRASTGDYIIMMDGDYSHRPEDIPFFLEQLERGAGLVIGSRILGGSEEYTPLRAFGNIFLTWIFGLLMGRYLSDALNGYKAFQRKLITQYNYFSSDFEIEIELIANALRLGMRITEIPSNERSRAGGSHKSRIIKNGLKFFLRIFIERIKTKSFKKIK